MSSKNAADNAAIEKLAIDSIRTLSMDGVQAANSGHPGTPMALAPITYTLFAKAMRHSPVSRSKGRSAP